MTAILDNSCRAEDISPAGKCSCNARVPGRCTPRSGCLGARCAGGEPGASRSPVSSDHCADPELDRRLGVS